VHVEKKRKTITTYYNVIKRCT